MYTLVVAICKIPLVNLTYKIDELNSADQLIRSALGGQSSLDIEDPHHTFPENLFTGKVGNYKVLYSIYRNLVSISADPVQTCSCPCIMPSSLTSNPVFRDILCTSQYSVQVRTK